jgi:hypothetical protein
MRMARFVSQHLGTLLSVAVACLTFTVGGATPAAADPRSPDVTCPGGELDNCYNEFQMDQFVDVGERMVNGFLGQHGVGGRPALIFVRLFGGVGGECGIQGDDAYDYCPADNAVYIGQSALWDFYNQYGAAGPIAGMAHEYGHFIQNVRGVPVPQTPTEMIRHEDQADCVAGAFVKYLQGLGDVEYPQDFRNLGDFLRAIGSKEGPGRDHGTSGERVHAFQTGFVGDLAACNRYYPRTPLT